MASTTGKRLEQLGVASPGLPLPTPPEIAAPGNAETEDNHGQQRRDSCGDGCPMEVDEGDAVDRLVDGSFIMVGLGGRVDREVRVVSNDGGVLERIGAGD